MFRILSIFTSSIARSATRRYLIYLEADFETFFAPQGRHVAPMGVKFGTEEGTEGLSSVPNRSPPLFQISPPSVQRKGIEPPKLKFLPIYDQNVEYKGHPLRNLHKNCRVCTAF